MVEEIAPTFTKDSVKIVDGNNIGGTNKRVYLVEIDGPNGCKRAILKFPRTFKAQTNEKLDEEDSREIDFEKQALRKLKMFIPNHVPSYIGEYQSSTRNGIIVEQAVGGAIADLDGNIINRPTRKQWESFSNSIISLADQGIFLDMDTLLLHNLMLGKVAASEKDEIILIEPRIRQHSNENMKVIERQFVLGGLRNGFNKLFPDNTF